MFIGAATCSQHADPEARTTCGRPRTPFRRECRSPTLFGGGKATIGSLTPGALVWLRVRTCGLKGVMGAWSDPAQIRVV